MRHFVIYMSCLLLAGSLGLSSAASTSIGTVLAPGGFQVDHARVNGSATLFDGTLVQTGKAAGDLRLSVGAKAQLASESRARVFRDRLVLEQGIGQVFGSGYRIEARSLQITGAEPDASARVVLRGQTQVLVASLTGHLRVTNSLGIVVANLVPGTALSFEPRDGAPSTSSRLTGVLRKHGKAYFLTDETTNVTFELRGPGLQDKVGKRVEVAGDVDMKAVPVKPATQVAVVKSTNIAAAATAAGAAGAGAAGAGAAGAGAAGSAGAAGAGAAAAGTAAGISATTVAVVGGVAAAGTVAGLGVTGSLPGQSDDSQTSTSR
jgi:hypothetical protein